MLHLYGKKKEKWRHLVKRPSRYIYMEISINTILSFTCRIYLLALSTYAYIIYLYALKFYNFMYIIWMFQFWQWGVRFEEATYLSLGVHIPVPGELSESSKPQVAPPCSFYVSWHWILSLSNSLLLLLFLDALHISSKNTNHTSAGARF